MLSSVSRIGGFLRFFSADIKAIEDKCNELFRTLIEPALEKEGIFLTFHGIEEGDRAVISLEGDALDEAGELRYREMPSHILDFLQERVPEVQRIRHKSLLEI